MIPDAIAVEINAAFEALNAAWRCLDAGSGAGCDSHLMVAAESIHRARDLVALADDSGDDWE